MNYTDYIVPAILAGVLIYGLFKRVDVFSEFIEGAKENMATGLSVIPALVALMTAVGIFRASGAEQLLTGLISPLTQALGFPAECVPLALIRPLSGSGATAVLDEILSQNHPDSFAGRVASVLAGSTETTFYTIAVYFGVTKVKRTRHVLPSAMAGDLTGFILSALTVRIFFG